MENDVLETIQPEDIVERPSNIVLLEKYKDFNNVFNKTKANKFPPHSMHNLAIKIQEDKIPPFSPIYNQSKLKLNVT